jgi:hypothetical protein
MNTAGFGCSQTVAEAAVTRGLNDTRIAPHPFPHSEKHDQCDLWLARAKLHGANDRHIPHPENARIFWDRLSIRPQTYVVLHRRTTSANHIREMIMMFKMGRLLGLLVVAGVLALTVSTAYAEFKSHSKSSEGTKTRLDLEVEGIGGTVNCGTLLSGPKWEIKNGVTPAETGALLALKFKPLSGCVTEYKEGGITKEVKTTSSECEWAINEPKAEITATLTMDSTCTLKPELSKACEVKFEPKENANREKVALFDSGEKSENLAAEFLLTKVTATVAGEGCSSAGIKSSSTATINGAMEVEQVQPGMATPEFSMLSNVFPIEFRAINAKKTISVANISAPEGATPFRTGVSTLVSGREFRLFTSENNTIAACSTTALLRQQTCPIEIKLTGTVANRWTAGGVQYFQGSPLTTASEVFLWGCTGTCPP